MEEVTRHRFVVRFHLDAPTIVAVVVPVEQGGPQAGDEVVGDVACSQFIDAAFCRRFQLLPNTRSGMRS